MKKRSILFPFTAFSIAASSLTSVHACQSTSDLSSLPEEDGADKAEVSVRPNVIFIYADDIGTVIWVVIRR